MMFRDRFDDDEDDEPKESEFTLGLGSLLGIFFGLVLLCGLFFGFGYTLGHGSSKTPTTHPSAATPESTQAGNTGSQLTTGGSKPAAQTLPPPAPAQPDSGQTTPGQTTSGQTANGTTPASSTTTSGTTSASQPANPPQQTNSAPPATQPQAVNPGAAQQVFQSAVPRTPSQMASSQHKYMVQVAAVSRPQDASVLVSALRQQGFHAVTRSEPTDHLMHVQVGPFNSLAAANQMRAELMADGYNAILKP